MRTPPLAVLAAARLVSKWAAENNIKDFAIDGVQQRTWKTDMNRAIQVFPRSIYGTMKIYPANEAAETLAQLVGKKTFDKRDLDLARALGLQVEAVVDPKLAGVL